MNFAKKTLLNNILVNIGLYILCNVAINCGGVVVRVIQLTLSFAQKQVCEPVPYCYCNRVYTWFGCQGY